ncbi:autotransporter outer membrane beta-barrel domain-containing protein [Bartonella sp. B41]
MIVRIYRKCLCSCVFTATVVFYFLSNINVKAYPDQKVPFLCERRTLPYRCNDGKNHIISNGVYSFTEFSKKERGEEDDFFTLPHVIIAQGAGTAIQAMNMQIKGTYGVLASKMGKIILKDSIFENVPIGLVADDGIIEVNGGSIGASKLGVYAENQGSSVILKDAKINVEGQKNNRGVALFSNSSANIKMTGGLVDVVNADALYVSSMGSITLKGVTIAAKNKKAFGEEKNSHAALNINQSSSIDLKDIKILSTDVQALRIGSDANAQQLRVDSGKNILVSRVSIEDSIIKVIGNTCGMCLDMDNGEDDRRSGVVFFKGVNFEVLAGTAIRSSRSNGYIAALNGTNISGDLLLKIENRSSMAFLIDSSSLTGGARVSDDSIVELYFTGNSKWLLTKKKERDAQDKNHITSSISFVKLTDSSIAFETPTSPIYQILRIGNGSGKVYSAQGDAHLHFNTYVNSDGSFDDQKTDRLLIHGDVFGKSTVHVQIMMGNQKESGDKKKSQDVSIIQVLGKAQEDSFLLSGGYIALEGFPYQYYLRAYGPNSSFGNAHASKKLIEGSGEFWDFRLESRYIQPDKGWFTIPDSKIISYLKPRVREVVPQVPTYLLLPNFLFHAGLVDIRNWNKQIKFTRSNFSNLLKINKNSSFSVHSYSSRSHYNSSLSAREYGYGGDIDYNAITTDLLLRTIENTSNTTSFGVAGTYGRLFLRPKDVKQSQKSTFDKWLLTTYGSVQYDNGFYMENSLSYGLFQGDVFTLARGKTATLKGDVLNISLSSGKASIIGSSDFIFDPQIQVIYQQLKFNKARDIGNFDIEVGNPSQWVMRVGGRLTKNFVESERDRVVSLYGKIYFAGDFGKKRVVYLKDTFQLGSFGSSLEAGIGIHSKLSQKIVFQGDFLYQSSLTKGGFSGVHFSGGLRYYF